MQNGEEYFMENKSNGFNPYVSHAHFIRVYDVVRNSYLSSRFYKITNIDASKSHSWNGSCHLLFDSILDLSQNATIIQPC